VIASVVIENVHVRNATNNEAGLCSVTHHAPRTRHALAEFVDVLLGGIYAYNTKSIEVLSSSFINCNGSQAGAIFIYSAGSFTSNNTRSVLA